MKNKRNLGYVLIPTVLSLGILGGIFIGRVMERSALTPGQEKLATILSLIQDEYVDEVNVDSLIEKGLPEIMSMLDPHSVYFSKTEMEEVSTELDNSFSGIGVKFQMLNDSVVVVEVIPGGPAEKVGIQAGDRIVSANGHKLTGPDITTEKVFSLLRGKEGTKALLKVKRSNAKKLFSYDVIRGKIPVNSVDGIYMIKPGIGYLRVSKFGTGTYDEFFNALSELQSQGAKKFIIDLRGNTGGYMEQAIFMANEFLPKGRLIVYSKGRQRINETLAMSDGNGSFQDAEITVLMDEVSASASEIFAGAIQDNDRGLVIGRRSFGKGLVQNQTILNDKSAIRLTVARYYTPSGRCIQKDYKKLPTGKYDLELADRYNRGEFYSLDSIKIDKSKRYTTVGGRTVFGGGGILPDVFVPQDTLGYTTYYINVMNQGLVQKFAFKVVEDYRQLLKGCKTLPQLYNTIPRDETLLNNFVDFAVQNGVPARWFYINQSKTLLLNEIKAFIAQDVLGYDAFLQALNEKDVTVKRAVSELEAGNSPTVIRAKASKNKKQK